jgi:ribosomal protein L37E
MQSENMRTVCFRCGFDVRGLDAGVCPECGLPLSWSLRRYRLRFLPRKLRLRVAVGSGAAFLSVLGLDACVVLLSAKPKLRLAPEAVLTLLNIAGPTFLLGLLASSLILLLPNDGDVPSEVRRYSARRTRTIAAGTAAMLLIEVVAFVLGGANPILWWRPTASIDAFAWLRFATTAGIWLGVGLWWRQFFCIVELLARRVDDGRAARRSALLAWLVPAATAATAVLLALVWLGEAGGSLSEAGISLGEALFGPVALGDIVLSVAVLWVLARLTWRAARATLRESRARHSPAADGEHPSASSTTRAPFR